MSEETKEMVELQRVTLTTEHAERLSAFTRMLNDNKLRIAEISLQLNKLEHEYKRLKGESEGQFATILGLINQTESDIKNFTNELVANYKINLDEGGWALSFNEGCFVRHMPKGKSKQPTMKPNQKKGRR